jgi:hypothetical protein
MSHETHGLSTRRKQLTRIRSWAIIFCHLQLVINLIIHLRRFSAIIVDISELWAEEPLVKEMIRLLPLLLLVIEEWISLS